MWHLICYIAFYIDVLGEGRQGMARPWRIECKGVSCHVFSRKNEGKRCFNKFRHVDGCLYQK